MSKLIEVSYTLIEVTSIPLLIVSLVYLLTGYAMISIKIQNLFSVIGLGYGDIMYLHTNIYTRLALVMLGSIHGFSGSIILIHKYSRRKTTRNILRILAAVALLIIIYLVIVAEI